jgi:uncharacterized membrane protein YidH (DUF202 family)
MLDNVDRVDEGGGRDPGLARERTELAWSRSGLSVAVTVAVTVRRLWPLTGDKTIVALVLIAIGGIIWVLGMQLGRRRRLSVEAGVALTTSTCRMVTIGTLILAAAAFVVGLFLPV